MDTTELALVRQRVADLHRDAHASRLAATARRGADQLTGRTHPGHLHRSERFRTAVRATVDRAAGLARSLRPVSVEAQACCA